MMMRYPCYLIFTVLITSRTIFDVAQATSCLSGGGGGIFNTDAGCCICGTGMALPNPNRLTADQVTCKDLEAAANAADDCWIFQHQYRDECCLPQNDSTSDVYNDNVPSTPSPTPKQAAVFLTDVCFVCGDDTKQPTNPHQTFELDLNSHQGTYTCEELDIRGRNGEFHPSICSYVQGLLSTDQDICSCRAESITTVPATPPPTPAPLQVGYAMPAKCDDACSEDNNCTCQGYTCDWRGEGQGVCSRYIADAITVRSKRNCRGALGGVRSGCISNRRSLRDVLKQYVFG